MKKSLLPLIVSVLGFSYSDSIAQCSVEAFPADTVVITCGDSAVLELSAFGNSGNFVIDNDFNDGTPGPGWDVTPGGIFTNPCVPHPDGTTYFWMGDATPQPRTLTTQAFDLTTGGSICFDMRFAIQGEATPCEGPDEPDEGVFLQYSIDNGATWVTINYFDPLGGNDPILTSWNQYCFPIPPAAETPSTKIRWFQNVVSDDVYDHWGLDNVSLPLNDPNYSFIWEHNGFVGTEPPVAVATSDSIFVVNYTDGTNTCSDTVFVATVPPVFTVATVSDTSICGDGCIELNGVADVLVRPESQPTFENNEFQPLQPPWHSDRYLVSSWKCSGSDSILWHN